MIYNISEKLGGQFNPEMSQSRYYAAQVLPKPEYIYIIAEKTTKVGTGGYTGYYKVGRTDNLQERLSTLQTGNPHQLECLRWIQVAKSNVDYAEKVAHAAVSKLYRSNENGGSEWYLVSLQYQANFIQQVLRGVQAKVAILGTNIR